MENHARSRLVSHLRVDHRLYWDRLSERARHLLYLLLLCVISCSLLLCTLGTNHLVERSDVVQETHAGKKPKNLTRRQEWLLGVVILARTCKRELGKRKGPRTTPCTSICRKSDLQPVLSKLNEFTYVSTATL